MFILTEKLNSLKLKANDIGKNDNKIVSPHYRIQDEKQKEYHVGENWKDVMDILDSYEEELKEEQNINIQYVGCLNKLAYHIVLDLKYVPHISVHGAMVNSLNLKIKHSSSLFDILSYLFATLSNRLILLCEFWQILLY